MNEALEFANWLLHNAHPPIWTINIGKWYYKEDNYTTEQLYEIWIAIK